MRELGKAKRADLNGHFAGEQHDAVAPLVRFLANARQISEVEEGRALGNDGTVVMPAHSQDTEAYPQVLQRAQGNGHNGNGHAGNNGHGGNGSVPALHVQGPASLAPDSMEPQPESDLFGDPIAPEPEVGGETAMDIAPVSSSDTVHGNELAPAIEPQQEELAPTMAAEPSLDLQPMQAQPALEASPEPEMQSLSLDTSEPAMDLPGNDTVFDPKLEPEAAPETAMDLKPAAPRKPDTDIKTRVMTPRDIKSRAQELAPEELKLETGQVAKLSPDEDLLKEEEETSVAKGGEEPEKITTKVEPKPAAPAAQGGVVRDTVNFYNQTMALRDLLESNQRPAPSAQPIATQKLPGPLDKPGAPIATHKIPPPPGLLSAEPQPAATQRIPPPPAMPAPKPPAPELAAEPLEPAQDRTELSPSLEPGDDSLEPSAEPETESRDEQTRAFMLADLAPVADAAAAESEEEDPDSTATRESKKLAPVPEVPELGAADEQDEADRKDTDRFNLADMRPADLSPPEGTDKIDKSALPQAEEDEGAPLRVADEEIAARRDTQRFFVSDLVGVATFKPAPKPVPLADEVEQGDVTSSGSTTGQGAEITRTSSETEAEPRATRNLPPPSEVEEDFAPPPKTSGTRIIPEYAESKRPGSSRLRSAASQPADKITEKVKQEAGSADTDKVPALGPGEDETPSESPVKKITDALTRRLRQERDETRKLIEEAEGVLLRLRQTPVSARHAKVEQAEEPADETEDTALPQPSAEPEEAFAGLPPIEDIASATIHDLRLAEQVLEASKAISAEAERKPRSGRSRAVVGEPEPQTRIPARDDETVADDALSRIERRLGGAAENIDKILASTSAALAKVTGELTREEFEERKRQRDAAQKPMSLRKALGSGRQQPAPEEPSPAEEEVPAWDDEPEPPRISAQSRRSQSGRSILEEEPLSRRTSARLAASSSLTEDLGKLLAEAASSTRMQSAAKADSIPRQEPSFELTEGPLWQSLLGIAGVTAFLAALFIWVWFLILSRGA